MVTSKLDEAAIFNVARQIEAAHDRRLYLQQACGEDRDLLARVEALLRVHDEERSFLESPTQELRALLGDRPGEDPGTLIGPYKLVQPIGEGGMGTVFLADQSQPIQRQVALKLIKVGLDSSQVIARFEAERQALALMDHPNIAKVLDAGTIPGGPAGASSGRPYFVMELVRGEPITVYCDAQRLTPRHRLELFIPVCKAVQHAHQKGIIHRDLKPSNVLIALYDGRPVPKVIDFGVAKATDRKLTEQTLLTGFGSVVGTLEYMSPEQAAPGQVDIDTRSDIYSLGVLLYELLTGTTPLQRKRLQEETLWELLRIVREQEPPTPSTRLCTTEELPVIAANRGLPPKKLSDLVRGDLDWIVMKCLEKDRKRRYETANALARDIERYLNEEPVEACPPSRGYRLCKFARKNRKMLVAAVAFALLLAAGTVVSTWQAVRATLAEQARSRERDKAVAEKKRADEQAAIAEAVNNFLNYDLLLQAAPEMTPDRDLKLRTVLDRASQSIGEQFASQPLVEAKIRATLAVVYQTLGEYPSAERHGVRARELYRDALGPEHAHTLAAMNNLAVIYTVQGRLEEARKLHEEILRVRRRVFGPEHPETLGSMNNLAEVLVRQDQLEEAHKLHKEVLQARSRILGPEDPGTLQSMMNVADVLSAQGQLEEARKLLEETLILDRRIRRPDYPVRATLTGSLAGVLKRLGRTEEAVKLYEETLQLARRLFGPQHPDTLLTVNNLACILATTRNPQLRDPPRAVELAKQAVHYMPKQGDNWNTLGVAYYALGDWPNAITALEKSEQLAPGRYLAQNGFFLAMAHWQLGQPGVWRPETGPPLTADEQARHIEEARNWYNRAAQWMEKNQPADKELLHFRAEASKLLGLSDTPSPRQQSR